jgi:Leucine-rich repeat (LRR) protein
MLMRTPYFFIWIPFFLLTACGSYDFTVNEKRVYTQKPLFSEFDVPDPALYACLKQAIIDEKVTSAIQLTRLNCSHAGIEDLQGLATFSGLTQLKLSSNAILNLHQITGLAALEKLYLDDNVVVDPVPLYKLPLLRLLDLSGNSALQCPTHSAFSTLESVKLPDHCS